jgi:hypothetical protein
VCAVTGSELGEALTAAADSGDGAKLTFAEAEDGWALEATPFQIDRLGATLMIVEPNGWRCSDASVAARLSNAGRAVSVFWNVNAVMRFVYADHGVVRREFDPLLYRRRRGTG